MRVPYVKTNYQWKKEKKMLLKIISSILGKEGRRSKPH